MNRKKMITIEQLKSRNRGIANVIFSIVCDYFGMEKDIAASPTRKTEYLYCRQIAHYFAKKHTSLSLSEIGSVIGSRDHATVLNSIRSVRSLIDSDRNYKANINTLERIIFQEVHLQKDNVSPQEVESILTENTIFMIEDMNQLIHEDTLMDGWRKEKLKDLLSRAKSNMAILKV